MKLSVILLLIFIQVNATGYSQTVTLNVNNESLFNVLKEITKQADINFIYGRKVTQASKPISITIQKATVDEVLQKCLYGQNLYFKYIDNKTIKIEYSKNEPLPVVEDTAKGNDLSGKVFNEKGEPLSGASVQIKRTGKGTHSKITGEYFLKDIRNGDAVVISFMGYQPHFIAYNGQRNEDAHLKVAVTFLDKVELQAYGKTSQRLKTGNIASMSAAEIERQPVANPLQALQGHIPGLVVSQTNGNPSAPFKVELRGRSNINPDLVSDPLYIIDGVPLDVLNFGLDNYAGGSKGFNQTRLTGPANGQSPLFSINPSDIESITVLKDGDATAIWGSRGANGVIIINTKKGTQGEPKLEVSADYGVSFTPRYYDMLNTSQYLELRREGMANDAVIPDIDNAYDLLVWDTTRYTNWQKEFWGNPGKLFNVNAALSGGDRLTNYRFSGAYRRQTSLNNLSGSDQKGNFLVSLERRSPNRKLTLSYKGIYSITTIDINVLSGNATLAPNSPPVYDEVGNLNYRGWEPISYSYPFGSILQPYTSKTTLLNSNFNINYKFLKGFEFSIPVGYSTNQTSNKSLITIKSQDPLSNSLGRAIFAETQNYRVIIEPQLDYKTFVGNAELTILAGGTYQTTSQNAVYLSGSGYSNDNLLNTISNAPSKDASNNNAKYKYTAIFGRIGYNLKNKFILNISGRRDGSSRFGPGRQFGNFGALGATWIFSEEKFISNLLPFLSFGKIRSSYGLTGSDGIGDYRYLTRWGFRPPYQGQPAAVPTQHANPDLRWQTDRKFEVGLELGFLKDRIIANISWYQNRIGNQLVSYKLPSQTGFTSVTSNFPAKVQNRGLELYFLAKLVEQKYLKWSFHGNSGINRNKLLSFPGIEQTPYKSLYKVGRPLNLAYVLRYTGVDPMTGLYTFEDGNKDGMITYNYGSPGENDDAILERNMSVKIEGGFGTEVTYKNFQLSAFFQYRIRNGTAAIGTAASPGTQYNTSAAFIHRWRKPGDITDYGRAYFSSPDAAENNNNFTLSDRVYTDASFVRLNNITLTYDLPKEWLRKIKISSFRVYVRAQNLFIISNYDGIDPEAQSFGSLPVPTIVTSGIQISLY